MVSTVDGYDYVIGADADAEHPHGDMDRIIIDGDIMPKRKDTYSATTGVSRLRLLRGEDVCFLMEWVRERIAAVERCETLSYQVTSSSPLVFEEETVVVEYGYKEKFAGSSAAESLRFSRKVSAAQLKAILAYSYDLDWAGWVSARDLYFFQETYLSSKSFKAFTSETELGDSEVLSKIAEKYYAQKWLMNVRDLPASGDALAVGKVNNLFSTFGTLQSHGVIATVHGGTTSSDLFRGDCKVVETSFSKGEGSTEWEESTSKEVILHSDGWFRRCGYHGGGAYMTESFPSAGQTFMRIYAPHASKVYAVLALRFSAYNYGGNDNDYLYVFKSVPMTAAGNGTFELSTDWFSGSSFFDSIVELAIENGLTVEESEGYRPITLVCRINDFMVVPVVFFDDHTRI